MGLRDKLKSALGVGGATTLKAGDPAPPIDLADASGARWTLDGLRGRPVVVYFYPKDDTPGCTREACDFRDLGARSPDVVVLGVSADDARSHEAFARKFSLPFPLLVDSGGGMAKRWGAVGLRGTRRVSFVLDRQGRVARVWDPVTVEGHAAEVLAVAAGL